MTAKYDIFKKTDENQVVWVETVQDIVSAKQRLISLTSSTPSKYLLWDSTEQKFIDPLEGTA
jgi:hypothetical protein